MSDCDEAIWTFNDRAQSRYADIFMMKGGIRRFDAIILSSAAPFHADRDP